MFVSPKSLISNFDATATNLQGVMTRLFITIPEHSSATMEQSSIIT